MMSDAKALKAAQNLKQYCGERGCDPEVCTFKTKTGICVLQAARLPEDYQLDHIRPERQNE